MEDSKTNVKIAMFETYDDGWGNDKWNVPVWEFKNEKGHTLIRGLSPRTNRPFLQIFLEDCIDKFDCLEITQEDIDGMD